ncbi:MAG: hypothetical protein WBL93_01275 [Lutisporaceae bacterium]
MANYYSIKCAYVNSQFYHRKQTAHAHNTQDNFVTDAKAEAVKTWKTPINNINENDITTTQIQSNISNPHVGSIEI